MFGACSTPPASDPPRETARLFCDLYLENADLLAILPFTSGNARAHILAEMSRLPPGAAGAPRPVVRATIVQEYPGTGTEGDVVSFRAEALISPPPKAAPGTLPRILSFTLTVTRQPGPGAREWRITFFQAA
jgi:hypothetical protein